MLLLRAALRCSAASLLERTRPLWAAVRGDRLGGMVDEDADPEAAGWGEPPPSDWGGARGRPLGGGR